MNSVLYSGRPSGRVRPSGIRVSDFAAHWPGCTRLGPNDAAALVRRGPTKGNWRAVHTRVGNAAHVAVPDARCFRLLCSVTVAAACAAAPPGGLAAQRAAQSIVLIRDSVACGGCLIESRDIVKLEDQVNAIPVRRPGAAAVDSRGRYLLTFFPGAHELHVIDGAGNLVRTVGREGAGPGEFRSISWIAADEAQFHVGDIRNQRITTYSNDFDLIRERPVAGLVWGAIAGAVTGVSQGLLLNGYMESSRLFGDPFHVIGAADTPTISFGDDGRQVGPALSFTGRRPLARAGGDRFWAAHAFQYRLELWDTQGVLHGRIDRVAPWFRVLPQGRPPRSGLPPATTITSIEVDDVGRIWVLLLVEDPNWQSAIRPMPNEAGGAGYRIADQDTYLDTMIEIIDPRINAVVARQRFDKRMIWLGKRVVISYSESAQGIPSVSIQQLSLIPAREGGTQ